MTDDKTFTVARGEVIHVNTVEYSDHAYYSVTVKFYNSYGSLGLSSFHNVGVERFNFFRDAMRNGDIVSFPELKDSADDPFYAVKKCFISDEQKEQESPLTDQKKS